MQSTTPEITATQTCTNTSEICATTIALPQFWTEYPEAWFIHSETQFSTKRITSDNSKYEATISALPPNVITIILDIIQKPPTLNKYETIKATLIERFSLSERAKLEKILGDSEIGDRKPSEFYRSLAQLAGPNFDTELLKKLWLRKLPKNLNVTLTTANVTDTQNLLRLADNIWEVMFSGEIATVKEPPIIQPPQTNNSLERMIEKLYLSTTNINNELGRVSRELDTLKRDFYTSTRRQSFSRGRSASRGRTPQKYRLCRYHYRFGSKARKCIQPCAYVPNSQTNPTN